MEYQMGGLSRLSQSDPQRLPETLHFLKSAELGLILRQTARPYIQFLNLHALLLLIPLLLLYVWRMSHRRVATPTPSVSKGGGCGEKALKAQCGGRWRSEVVRVLSDTVGMAWRGLVRD